MNRGELASKFSCSPSQINYVLGTRFTAERGFVIESRRGGGGYLRIIRTSPEQHELSGLIGTRLTQKEAYDILDLLQREKFISWREAYICRQAVNDSVLCLTRAEADKIRARFLKSVLPRVGKGRFPGL